MQSWNDILMQRYNNDEFKKRGPPSKEDIYEMLSSRKLKSGLYLEVRVHTTVPISAAYDLTYDFKYSAQHTQWTEAKIRSKEHISKATEFEYSY